MSEARAVRCDWSNRCSGQIDIVPGSVTIPLAAMRRPDTTRDYVLPFVAEHDVSQDTELDFPDPANAFKGFLGLAV